MLTNSSTPVLTPTAAMLTTPGKRKSTDDDQRQRQHWQSAANAALSSASSTTSSRNSRSFSSTTSPRKVYGKKQLQQTTQLSNHLSPSLSSVKSTAATQLRKNEAIAAAAEKNKRTIITPRTRARSIISTLASPRDFLLLTPTTTTMMGGADSRVGGETTTTKRIMTPRHNSTAEATLHKLARRMTTAVNCKQQQQQPSHGEGEEEEEEDDKSQHTRRKGKTNNNGDDNNNYKNNSNDGDTMVVVVASANKKKRKAANDARAKISTICDLDRFDDLDSLLRADNTVYNTEIERLKRHRRAYGSNNRARDGRSKTTIMEKNRNTNNNVDILDGGLTATAAATTTTASSDYSVTADIVMEETMNNNENTTRSTSSSRGGIKMRTNDNDEEQQWLHNFRKWRTLSSEGDLHNSSSSNNNNTTTTTTSTSLPISWMAEQHIQYHKLQCGDKSSTMTQDRAALLVGAGFVWEEVGTKETEELTIIDQSLSPGGGGRKSPRKSLPTQFYHKEEEDVTNNNNKKKRSKVISIAALRRFGALPSSSASPVLSKKTKQQSSGSSTSKTSKKKRTSPPESLASLPDIPDVIMKADNDDKQEEEEKRSSKKKKSRGRHSTSSLLSLDANSTLVVRSEEKVLSGSKGLVMTASEITTLTHKELEEVLSKSKRKPRVQKKKMTSNDNKVTVMKSNLLSDMAHDDDDEEMGCGATVEFEASATEEYVSSSSSQSPVSPLRITRLLPALMNSDTTTVVGNKKKNIAGGSSLKLSRKDATDAIVDAPSISQLLMSCLSTEDSSAETKKKNNAKVHPPSSSSPSVAKKLIAGVRAPGSPLRRGLHMSTIDTSPLADEQVHHIDTVTGKEEMPTSEKRKRVKPRKDQTSSLDNESIPHQEVAPHIDTITGEEDDMPGRPRKYLSSKVDGGDKTKLVDEYPLPQCTMVADKITQTNDTNIEDTVADMEECSLDKKSITQANDMNIEDTAATTEKELKHCTIWTCDICRVATFDDYFDAEEHEKECAIANNLQEIPPPSEEEYGRSTSPLSPLVDEADKLQSPPSPLISPTHFSPVTLSSPKHGQNYASGYQTGHHRVATKSSTAASLVLGGENRQLCVPSGSHVKESSQRQMIVTQQMHAGLTEYGRLQLESQLVTQRMRDIEEAIKQRSNKLSRMGGIDDIATSSRKRSYRAESRSASIKHQRQYEYSEEEYSDEYHSSRKRRRLNNVPDDYINDQRGYSGGRSRRRSEMHINSSKARRSISSRSGQRYNESGIEMGISHRSKKIEQYHADRSSPKSNNRRGDKVQHVSRSYMPYESHHVVRPKKKLQGYNTDTRDATARPRQTKATKQMQNKQYLRSSLEKASPADSPASYELPRYSLREEEEESPPRTNKSRGKSHQRNEREHDNRADMSSSVPNFEAGINYSDKASPIHSPGKSKGESTNIPAQSSNFQVIRTKDPMIWLAEEENSSDDESWDFDGPMILPPSPIF